MRLSWRQLAGVILFVLLAAQPAAAQAATPSPSPSPCPSPAPTLTPGPAPTPSSTASDLCAQQASLQQVRDQLGAQLAAGLAANQTLQQSLAENARQQSDLQVEITAAQARITDLETEIAQLNDAISVLQARILRNETELGRLARVLYFTPTPLLLRLLHAGSLREMLSESAQSAALGERARTLHQELLADKQRVIQDRARKQTALDEQQATEQQLLATAAALAALRQQQEETAAQLAIKIQSVRSELARVDVQSVALTQKITAELEQEQEALIAKAMEEAWAQLVIWQHSQQGAPGSTPTTVLSLPLADAVLTQAFGPSTLWFEPPFAGFAHFHTGLDLAAPENSPVTAAAAGTVAVVGSGQLGYGNYVIIAHAGGMATLYGHLNQSLVKVGDQVMQGQPIGLEGSTGNSTGPHLHFELRIDGQPVDPSPYLTRPK